MMLAVKLEDGHYPVCSSVPEVGDMVYVPTYAKDNALPSSIINANRFGGAATVETVRKNPNGTHYITVTELTGYFEINWERDLANKQEELASRYGFEKAYIKI